MTTADNAAQGAAQGAAPDTSRARPPRDTVSSLNYRDADDTPTDTNPALSALAAAALSILARHGADGPADPAAATGADHRTWTWNSGELTLACTGPDLPEGVPAETAHPSLIPMERPWVGDYRLVVRAPIIAMDLYWRAGAPLRIMTFSRGDWEGALLEAE